MLHSSPTMGTRCWKFQSYTSFIFNAKFSAGIWYTDSQGGIDEEYLSLGNDVIITNSQMFK